MVKFVSFETTREAAYNKVRAKPLDKIREPFDRRQRDHLLEQCIEALVGFTLCFDWTRDANGTNYGAMAEVTGPAWYQKTTGITTYQLEEAPPAFDDTIDEDTSDYDREKLLATHAARKESFATLAGAREGINDNIMAAMPKKYYAPLKKRHIGYKGRLPTEFFDHFDEEWCKVDAPAIKKLKAEYFRNWDVDGEPITLFIKHLNEDQEYLKESVGITISDDDKLQHFLLQMYRSNHFDKEDFKKWE